MTAPDPLPSEEEADRYFTQVPPPRSQAPPPAASRRPAPRSTSRWTRLTTTSPTTGVAPLQWLWLVAVLALLVFLIGRSSSAAAVPAWKVPDGACTDRRPTSPLALVLVLDCADAGAQVRVTARFQLPEGPYPDRDAAVVAASRTCTRPPDDPRLGALAAVVPSAQEWDDGSHVVLCTYLVR